MENFAINLSAVSQRIEEEQNMKNTLSLLESDICSVRRCLSFQVRSREGLQGTLDRLAGEVGQFEADVERMRSALVNISMEYKRTEERICGQESSTIGKADIGIAMPLGVGIGVVRNALFCSSWDNSLKGTEKDSGEKTEDKWLENKWTLWKEPKEKKWTREDGKWMEVKGDSSKGGESDKDKAKEIGSDITIWSIASSVKGSMLHLGQEDVKTDWGSYSYTADFLKQQWNKSFDVTLGGVEAEVGVALSAFAAQSSAQLGNDLFGLHTKTQLDVANVEAGGKFAVRFLDKDGKFAPQGNVKLSGEANLLKVSQTIGMDIAGTKMDVKGSFQVGVGGHLDIGFQDGKFSLDIGACLGIGGSVKLDLDVSGTIDNIIDCAGNIGSAAADAYQTTTEFIEGAADAVGDFVEDAAGVVGDLAEGVGKTLNQGWATVSGWFGW